MKLHKDNLAIHRATSKENSRYTIRGIQIDTETKAAIATDGHIMVIIGLPEQDSPLTSTLISTECCQAAEKLTSTKDPTVMTDGLLLRGIKGVTEIKTAEGQFPSWRAVMPKGYEDGFYIHVNPQILRQLADILERVTPDYQPTVRMSFAPTDGQDKPIRFDTVTEDGLPVTALLMPMRGKQVLHSWADSKPAEAISETVPKS